MNTVTPIQLRVTISDELRKLLQEKAESFGLTMSAYVKNLIIHDLKENQQVPIDLSLTSQRRKYYLKKLEQLK
ncbi:MAG: hypothetical protein ABI425_03880 [Patescibacteria group bacterium]